MLKLLQLVSISAALALGLLGLIYFPEIQESLTHEKQIKQSQENDYARAIQLLDLKRPLEASALIKTYKTEMNSDSEAGKRWLDLFVRASDALPDTDQLILIYQHDPAAFSGHESAALKVGSRLIANKDWKNYEQLRGQFKGPSKLADDWFLLDSDSLILQGKSDRAFTTLQSRYLQGPQESARLLRLALLQIEDHPKIAWEPLDEAYKKDAANTDLHYYRARFLETSGKPDLAHKEYYSLSKMQNKPAFLETEVANFYLRQNQYKLALQSLAKRLNQEGNQGFVAPANETLWIKGIFLSKAYEPLPFNFQSGKSTKNSPFMTYVLQIPENQFWDEKSFSKVPQNEQIFATFEEAFWLPVLENLRTGRERDALTLLQHTPLNLQEKELSAYLKTLLQYRLNGTLTLPVASKNPNLAKFYTLLNTPESAPFLKSPAAIATLFLAKGWNEAALKLTGLEAFDSNAPEWATVDYARALRQNRGLKEAFAFLDLQPSEQPALLSLKAELFLENNEPEKALHELELARSNPGESGEKATWMAAQILFSQQRYEEMRRTLQANATLAGSTKAQELIARSHLKEENKDEATKVYAGIEESSSEAKSYLSKQAFEERDFRRAFILTKLLLTENPENPLLKDNLNLIMAEMEN